MGTSVFYYNNLFTDYKQSIKTTVREYIYMYVCGLIRTLKFVLHIKFDAKEGFRIRKRKHYICTLADDI